MYMMYCIAIYGMGKGKLLNRDMEGDREAAIINTEKGNDITIQLFTHTLQPYSASCKILC